MLHEFERGRSQFVSGFWIIAISAFSYLAGIMPFYFEYDSKYKNT